MCYGNNLGNLSTDPLDFPQPPLFIAHCVRPGCRRVFHAVDAVSAVDAMARHVEAAHQDQKES